MTAAFGVSGDRSLRSDAVTIWRAAVAAVDSNLLVRKAVTRHGDRLEICGHALDLSRIGRICVVGGGKAGAGMAAGLEQALGPDVVASKVSGLLNVPADCVAPLQSIRLHAGRPAGVNEPTQAGVAGAAEMLHQVGHLEQDDLCLVLLSGGASALLPAPVPGISPADKQAVTRFLSRAGANIRELNCVRKQLSQFKGGRLAAACKAGTLIALIISDIAGDPLDVIGSGPTVADPSTPADALAVLTKFDPQLQETPASIVRCLREAAARHSGPLPLTTQVFNHIIGNNLVALTAGEKTARELGYEIPSVETNVEGVAEDLGRKLARRCRSLAADAPPRAQCVLSGGEPVVRLQPSARPQKGGRNQELALAAVAEAWSTGLNGICILSGGTDGEDGPTDAAGAIADQSILEAARRQSLNPSEFLADHNSYEFFSRTDGLLITGPTHTNVMDVRVALVGSRD